jgi:hypothetical protein
MMKVLATSSRLATAVLAVLLIGCEGGQPLEPFQPHAVPVAAEANRQAAANDKACWGQASAVFARMGLMGEHASGFDTPRLGLRNLARALFEAGVLEDDSMQALGAFVAAELGLSIDACGT